MKALQDKEMQLLKKLEKINSKINKIESRNHFPIIYATYFEAKLKKLHIQEQEFERQLWLLYKDKIKKIANEK